MLKRILVILLLAAMLLSYANLTVFSSQIMYGDINGNGKVTAADALLVLQFSVKKIVLTDAQKILADADGNGSVSSADALLILQFAVGKIKELPISMNQEQRYYNAMAKSYNATFKDFEEITRINDYTDAEELVMKMGGDNKEEDVEVTPVDQDGRLLYTPLSNAARKRGVINKYDQKEKITGSISLNDTVLTYSLPTDLTAYDMVPIDYSLTTSESTRKPIHFGVTAFEEVSRYTDAQENYFDCNLPGEIAFDFEYLGYLNCYSNGDQPSLSYNILNDIQGNSCPDFERGELIYSGTLETGADYTYLKFRYTNTGNTILDGEGNGCFKFRPVLYRKDSAGQYEEYGYTTNDYENLLDYFYPGESGEMWLTFDLGRTNNNYGLTSGEYMVKIFGYLRNERGNSEYQIWGNPVCYNTFEFSVKNNAEISNPIETEFYSMGAIPRNGWVASFEEFMSSYITKTTVSTDKTAPTKGTVYVQVAPWTEVLTLKIMHASQSAVSTVKIPVKVESDSLSVTLNPYNENYHINRDGTRTPLIMTQNMADMRVGWYHNPFVAETILNDLLNMKEAGINYITTTNAMAGATSRYYMTMYMLDMAKELNFDLDGFTLYPYSYQLAVQRATPIASALGMTIGSRNNVWNIPGLYKAHSIIARWNYLRYGKMYYISPNETIPISVEDNWGWMTQVHDWYHDIGSEYAKRALRNWLEDAYGDIDTLNSVYGSSYNSFQNIDPASEGSLDSSPAGMGWYTLNNPDSVYNTWSRASLEYGLMRTAERMKGYAEMLEGSGIKGAKVSLRTENTAYLAAGISPNTKNAHYRQNYYEQRRSALVPEIIAASGVVYMDSNFSAVPYTPTEVFELTRQAAAVGIVTAKTPPFNRMHDFVINRVHGDIKYVENYNLETENLRGCNMAVMTSLFEYSKAIYEAGGIPGTFWQDYHADLMITSTQYKELKFFSKKIKEMLSTKEGLKWSTEYEAVDREEITKDVIGTQHYKRSYILETMENIERHCVFSDSFYKLMNSKYSK